MNIIVRFYKKHDLDLLELKARENFQIGKQIKKSLCAYVRGENFSIEIPQEKPDRNYFKNDSVLIKLNSEKDKDVIDFMRNIHPGFRNSAIKLILRGYLPMTNIAPYVLKEDTGRNEIKKKTILPAKVKPDTMSAPLKELEEKKVDDINDEADDFNLFSAVDKLIGG